MTGCALTAIEWLLVALVRLRAALLRRRWLPAAQAAALKRCRSCGCDDTHSCIEFVPCHWAAPDLCSWCAEVAE